MNRKERRDYGERVVDALGDDPGVFDTVCLDGVDFIVSNVYQRRPFTMVRLCCTTPTTAYEGLGFSKVCYPDRWSDKYGKQMALKKATAHIMKQVGK